MSLEAILLTLVAFVAAVALTGLTRKLALHHRVLDVPNERSSHVVAMPRGGGIATVIANTASMGVLTLLGVVPVEVFTAVCIGGLAIAAVGFMDDRQRLSAKVRLFVHVAAALWALAWLGGLPPLRFGWQVFELGWMGYVLGVLGIVWTLNLFNFMDGIDGIAASEAVFIAVAGALTHWLIDGAMLVPVAAWVFGAACLGFLVWNWPPAKIFMGDVGSGYMGFVIAVLAILAAHENAVALLIWLIFGAAFFVDATVTLIRRVARKESPSEAHRSHAYQWLSRRWGDHKKVTVTTMVVNVLWLLPCGLLAAKQPMLAGWIALGAVTPLVIAAILIGAGRPEVQTKS